MRYDDGSATSSFVQGSTTALYTFSEAIGNLCNAIDDVVSAINALERSQEKPPAYLDLRPAPDITRAAIRAVCCRQWRWSPMYGRR